MKESYNITLNNEKIIVTIDPCSWMYKYYGLQLTAKLESTGEKITLNLKKNYEDCIDNDVLNLCESLYIANPCKCGNSRLRTKSLNHSTNRGDLCESCFCKKIDEELEIELAEEEKQIKKYDEKMKKKGFNFKITAWIHNRGDDKQVDVYFITNPTQKDITKALKQSVVKNDYTIYTL